MMAAPSKAVDFPGPQPGNATSSQDATSVTLQNAVISQSWQIRDGTLTPLRLTNKLSGETFDQSGCELFRLLTQPPAQPANSEVYVGVRLEADHVTAVASDDGKSWVELESFPRSDFPGDPKIVRLGKMNLQAQAKNYDGPAGEMGAGTISEIAGHPPFAFRAAANHAATTEYAYPTGSDFVSCRIDKGTDQGQSWAPALAVIWEDGRRFLLVGARNVHNFDFNVTTGDGERIVNSRPLQQLPFDLQASHFKLAGVPRVEKIEPIENTARRADRIAGVAVSADLESSSGLHVHWRAELRDGSNYVRQTIRISSQTTIPLYGVEFSDVKLPHAATIGTCPGSPVASDDLFLGVEMPGAQNTVEKGRSRISFACKLEVSSTQSYWFGSVTGVAARNQLRRSFLYYIERERARQSSPFLHYNCWYDLAETVNAAELLDAVRQFESELVNKRGVPVQSYLVDDGWDSADAGFWKEDPKKFPGGFAALHEKMAELGANMGVWISPLGGYGEAPRRAAVAQKMGLIPPGAKLDFSYPAYKQWFENRCLQFMREDGVNAFKWDKAGDGVSPHFMALLDIAQRLRQENPNLFINVTVGTWPSPFWLNHIDSTWRNGSADVGWAGKGDDREKWITYRDGYCHRLFVQQGPLYPLNSMMAHGIVFGRHYQGAQLAKTGPNMKNEVRSYFAMGLNLQEMYITPSLMTSDSWDQLAEAAKWAHANADVLVDSHWVGGDPLRLQPYGYAAWNQNKGTLMIRNPDDAPRTISLDAQEVFDLPAGAARHYALTSPYKHQRLQSMELSAGEARAIQLDPFEVLVFDAIGR